MVTLDQNLIPTEVQAAVIEGVVNQSVALTLGNVQPMPTMAWTSQLLKAEEVAATIDVPTAYLDDAGFPLWDSIQPRMIEALALVIDEAVLFGVGAPASFPAGGVLAKSTAAALPAAPAADMAGLYNACLSIVESQGLDPTGHAADVAARGRMRGSRTTTGEPLFVPSIAQTNPDTIFGLPVAWSRGGAFDTTKALSFTGDWTCLRLGVRQDVTVDSSAEGVLVDNTGAVVVSAFQDDKIIMRVHMRLGCVIGQPVTQKVPAGAKPWSHIPPAALPAGADFAAPEETSAAEAPANGGNGGNGGKSAASKES